MRILIGDKFGKIIAEPEVLVGPTSWILNEIGRSVFYISRKDSKATEEVLEIGNRVYIDFNNGLPVWGGVIDLPRGWQQGVITVHCYGIEQLLRFRRTAKAESYYGYLVGGIFHDSIDRTNQVDPLGIDFGHIWYGGREHYPRYNYKDLWYVINYSIRVMETCDFRFEPYISGEQIRFRATFRQVYGIDKHESVALIQDKNVDSSLMMEEQGDIINRHIAVAEGSVWDESRSVRIAQSPESIAKYGLREYREIYPKVSMPATLELLASKGVEDNANPKKFFTLETLDAEPAPFASYDIGDTVHCELPDYTFGGFRDDIRVKGREYDPLTGKASLVVEHPEVVQYYLSDEALEESDDYST